MRAIRRLPTFLRALSLLGMLALLAAVSVLTWASRVLPGDYQSFGQRFTLCMFLLMLAMACNVMVIAHNLRFKHPGRSAPWPDAWQVQLTVVLALAALPLCSLLFALLVPPSPSMYDMLLALQILATIVLAAGCIWVFVRYYG